MRSSTSSPAPAEAESSWLAIRLLAATLAGPLAFLLALEAAYVASYASCTPDTRAHFHAALLVPCFVALGGAALAWRTARRRPLAGDPGWANAMAHTGLWLSLSFVFLILTMYVPALGLLPCV